jgi:hypothetical protein
MVHGLCAALAVALMISMFSLCREVRLRRALIRLIQLLLAKWRKDDQQI